MQWESNMSFCSFKLHISPNTVVLCNAAILTSTFYWYGKKWSEMEEFAQPKLRKKKAVNCEQTWAIFYIFGLNNLGYLEQPSGKLFKM